MSRIIVRVTILMSVVLITCQAGYLLAGSHCNCDRDGDDYAVLPAPAPVTSGVVMGAPQAGFVSTGYPAPVQGHWQPGGYEGRIGSPYYYQETPTYGLMTSSYGYGYGGGYAAYGYAGYGSYGGDPYTTHFGPGYYRNHEHGHYRFPYYSYRRPWYYPGHPVYNRDTNFAW